MMDILENDFGFRDGALQWVIYFLTDRKKHVVIRKSASKLFDLSSGVLQGSCLGLVLTQGYADDTQLYLSFQPDSTSQEALRA